MRYLQITAIVLFGLIAPGTVFYYLSPWGIRPDILMLWVIYFSLHSTRRPALIMALTAGLLADFYIGSAVGQYAFTYCVVALISMWLQKGWDQDNVLSIVVLVLSVSLMGQIVLALLAALSGVSWTLEMMVKVICGVSIYNAVLVLLTYPLIHRSFNKGWLRKFAKYDLID